MLDDSGNTLVVDYLVNPTSVTSSKSPLAPSSQAARTFAGITYDGSSEFLSVEGTNGANTFDVKPSLSTNYFIDGNLPAPGTVAAEYGDYLELEHRHDRKGAGDHVPRGGKLELTSGHKPVQFASIEKFNHVDIVAVAADAGSTSKPLVRVYDAETNELKFQIAPSLTYGDSYHGGVRVATGDIDNDGLPDVVTVPARTERRISRFSTARP